MPSRPLGSSWSNLAKVLLADASHLGLTQASAYLLPPMSDELGEDLQDALPVVAKVEQLGDVEETPPVATGVDGLVAIHLVSADGSHLVVAARAVMHT